MSKIWGFLSSVGLAESVQEDGPAETPPIKQPEEPSKRSSKLPPSVDVSVDRSLVNQIDEDSKKNLIEALNKETFPVIEAFQDIIGPLTTVIPDESVRYSTALNILAKKHPTDALLNDYDKSLGVVDETKRQFDAALEGQLEKRVGGKIRSVEQYDEKILSLESQINDLTNQLIETRAIRESEHESIAEEQTRLDLTKDRFGIAHQSIRRGLDEERAKIAKYGDKL